MKKEESNYKKNTAKFVMRNGDIFFQEKAERKGNFV